MESNNINKEAEEQKSGNNVSLHTKIQINDNSWKPDQKTRRKESTKKQNKNILISIKQADLDQKNLLLELKNNIPKDHLTQKCNLIKYFENWYPNETKVTWKQI